MVGRGAWLAGASLLGYVVACNVTTGPFTCADDGDCILQGTPGVCDGEGRCSYPDDACSSGYSYPAATPEVGGDCAPDPGFATGGGSTDGSAGTSSSGGETTGAIEPGSTSGETTGQLDSVGSEGSSSSGDDGLESSGGETTSSSTTGMATTGGVACPDTVGNSAEEAEVLDGCFMQVGMGTVVDGSDQDWWVLQEEDGGNCSEGLYEAFVKADGLTVCLVPQCEAGFGDTLQCLDGSSMTDIDGLDGCCGDGGVAADIQCTFNSPAALQILVYGSDAQCSEYVLGAGLAGG